MYGRLALRKIEGIQPERLVAGLGQNHRHAVALHHLPDAGRNLFQQIAQLQVRHHPVRQIQQQLQPLARAFRRFEIHRVVGGQRDLVRHQRKEQHVFVRIRVYRFAGDAETAQPAVFGRQRNRAGRTDPERPEHGHHLREELLALGVANHQRLLILMNPPRNRIFRSQLLRIRTRMRMNHAVVKMDFPRRLVELHDPVKRQHAAQLARQQLKQFLGIAMPSDRLGDADQGAITGADRPSENSRMLRHQPHISSLDALAPDLDALNFAPPQVSAFQPLSAPPAQTSVLKREQIPRGPHINCIPRQSRRGDHFLPDLIPGQHLQLIRIRRDHRDHSLRRSKINSSGCRNG